MIKKAEFCKLGGEGEQNGDEGENEKLVIKELCAVCTELMVSTIE